MKLIFEFHFNKKDGYNENDFLNIISNNINELKKEMKISSLEYSSIEDGYAFSIEFQPVLPMFTYQPILGCFSTLEMEYPYIRNTSIPMDRMQLLK